MIQNIKDKLTYRIYGSRAEMGEAAANDAYEILSRLLKEKDEVNVIFAAAPSQDTMLAALKKKDLDWSRINAFHMDEYVGLSQDAPQGFFNFLSDAIFSHLPFKSKNRINGNVKDAEAECQRYADLLKSHPCDLCLMGIGENGHIAFNDPHVAFFNDSAAVKTVSLDDVCRQQQVNDGCFKTIDDVPKQAFTLTIPSLFAAKNIICVVPAKTKANAVYNTINGDVSEKCPASVLRRHENAFLYLDPDSASLLK